MVHEPLAPLQVVPEHGGGVGDVRAADDAEDAVPTESRAAVAQPADQRGVQPVLRPDGAVGIGQDDEVVLRPVPEQHPGSVCHVASSLALVGHVPTNAVSSG